MIRITHDEACDLEILVRNVYGCDRFGIMGLADADYFEVNPLHAAILIFAPKFRHSRWSRKEIPDITEFLSRYDDYFTCDDNEYDAEIVDRYISELEGLIRKYYRGCIRVN